KNLLLFCLTLLIIQMANSCDKMNPDCKGSSNKAITIINQSSRTINPYVYWDTTIIDEDYNPLNDGTNGTNPGESYTRGTAKNRCWEAELKDGKVVWIYFFDHDSLKAIPWDTVRATGRGLLERRFIDLEYLMANDFKVIYM